MVCSADAMFSAFLLDDEFSVSRLYRFDVPKNTFSSRSFGLYNNILNSKW